MLPPYSTIERGLRQATEALARQMASPADATPAWDELEWRLACAAAAAHGVSPWLARHGQWRHAAWQAFVREQRDHVAQRHERLAALLARIDASARSQGIAMVALKGSALHAMGLYVAGDRPMADIDLLVNEADARQASRLLLGLGYVESFSHWKHLVFKPRQPHEAAGLGEHRDTPINIELHTRIQERLPVSLVDLSARVHPPQPHAGINGYPSTGALMAHLLLHAAGNVCNRTLRLVHVHDIAGLSRRMSAGDWRDCLDADADGPPWWMFPPLRLVARYYGDAIPAAVLEQAASCCPPLLRLASRRQTLTRVSCSHFWLQALPGLEWSRSIAEMARYARRRIRPPAEVAQERADMVRTQLWLKDQRWVTTPQLRRVLTRLTRPVPRMDTLYVVRAALEPPAP